MGESYLHHCKYGKLAASEAAPILLSSLKAPLPKQKISTNDANYIHKQNYLRFFSFSPYCNHYSALIIIVIATPPSFIWRPSKLKSDCYFCPLWLESRQSYKCTGERNAHSQEFLWSFYCNCFQCRRGKLPVNLNFITFRLKSALHFQHGVKISMGPSSLHRSPLLFSSMVPGTTWKCARNHWWLPSPSLRTTELYGIQCWTNCLPLELYIKLFPSPCA